MLEVILLYLLHGLLWFCFGAFVGILRGHGAMKIISALALGVFSASAHMLLRYFGCVP